MGTPKSGLLAGVSPWDYAMFPVAVTKVAANAGQKAMKPFMPKQPGVPALPPTPDTADEAVQNARIMERRKQLGLQGRMSTFLTTAQGDQAPAQTSAPKTLLGQ